MPIGGGDGTAAGRFAGGRAGGGGALTSGK